MVLEWYIYFVGGAKYGALIIAPFKLTRQWFLLFFVSLAMLSFLMLLFSSSKRNWIYSNFLDWAKVTISYKTVFHFFYDFPGFSLWNVKNIKYMIICHTISIINTYIIGVTSIRGCPIAHLLLFSSINLCSRLQYWPPPIRPLN